MNLALAKTAFACNWRAWLAGALFLCTPLAVGLHKEVHLSQASWLGLAVAGGMFALVVRNAGAALMLFWSCIWMLLLGVLHTHGMAKSAVIIAASQTHGHLVAGVAILALAPLIFAHRAGLLLLVLRVLVLVCLAWWLAELSGLDPLLKPARPLFPNEMRLTNMDGLRGACLGSPVALAGLMGAAWPLFVTRRWWPCLIPLVFCLSYLNHTTGHIAALASVAAWGVAKIRSTDRVYPPNWKLSLGAYGIVTLLFCAGVFVRLVLHQGPGAGVRRALWEACLLMSRLIGWGPGSFQILITPVLQFDSPHSAYALVLFEYGWLGAGLVALGLWQVFKRAFGSPMLFAACVGICAAAGGTMIAENAVTAGYALMLFGLVEVIRED